MTCLSVMKVCTSNTAYIFKMNSLRLRVLDYNCIENLISLQPLGQTVFEGIIALFDLEYFFKIGGRHVFFCRKQSLIFILG